MEFYFKHNNTLTKEVMYIINTKGGISYKELYQK